MVDRETKRIQRVSNWRLRHDHSCSSPNVDFYKIKLSKEEANYVADHIARTPRTPNVRTGELDALPHLLQGLVLDHGSYQAYPVRREPNNRHHVVSENPAPVHRSSHDLNAAAQTVLDMHNAARAEVRFISSELLLCSG
jgi:hypothetical protein